MKTLLISLLIHSCVAAQPFLGLLPTDKGAAVQVGFLIAPVEITVSYRSSLIKTNKPAVLSATLGYQMLLSNNEKDNYSLSAHVGIANYRTKDFSPYEADPTGRTGPVQLAENRPTFALELGKDSYLGRAFITAGYCKGMYYGVGVKLFAYRK